MNHSFKDILFADSMLLIPIAKKGCDMVLSHVQTDILTKGHLEGAELTLFPEKRSGHSAYVAKPLS